MMQGKQLQLEGVLQWLYVIYQLRNHQFQLASQHL